MIRCLAVGVFFLWFCIQVANGMTSCGGLQDAVGQPFRPTDQVSFILHLLSRGDNTEALFLLDRMYPGTDGMADTIAYLKGWTLYQQKKLLPSATHLMQVSESSPHYLKSRFFSAYNLAYSGNVEKAGELLEGLNTGLGGMPEGMKNFQLAGLALLDRNYDAFQTHSEAFSGRFFAFASQEAGLRQHCRSLQAIPVRSPLVAGLLSAAVPGLGKVYAGKGGEGVAGFLYTLAMGATAYDFYRGAGPKSALFIVSASVAGIFYVGNIWGSVVAVHRKKTEYHHEIDQRILFDLHIPLRNAFN